VADAFAGGAHGEHDVDPQLEVLEFVTQASPQR
jgi:hypothetical protein